MLLPMLEAIRIRRSVRTYEARSLSPELRREIEALLSEPQPGYFGGRPRFALIERDRARRDEKVRLGTYGFIKGAPYFIAGAIERGPRAEADFGYRMEKIVLEMTRRGLGTCWLGGTFSREEYARILRLDGTSWVPAILSLGYPAATRGIVERIIRRGAKADSRLPWSELFFDGDFSTPLEREAAGAYAELLDLLRIGPSASNKQPWRVLRDGRGLHLVLVRTPSYQKWVPNTDLQQMDLGIAMCHVEEAACALGLAGGFTLLSAPEGLPEGAEYIVTWTPA